MSDIAGLLTPRYGRLKLSLNADIVMFFSTHRQKTNLCNHMQHIIRNNMLEQSLYILFQYKTFNFHSDWLFLYSARKCNKFLPPIQILCTSSRNNLFSILIFLSCQKRFFFFGKKIHEDIKTSSFIDLKMFKYSPYLRLKVELKNEAKIFNLLICRQTN